jgi:hypothetical protein
LCAKIIFESTIELVYSFVINYWLTEYLELKFFSAAPILVLGNVDNEMIAPQSREPSDLRPVSLPEEAAVALELEPEQKQCCSNKPSVDIEGTQPAGNTARNVVSGELKDKLWAQASGKEVAEDQLSLTTTSVPCSVSAGVAGISSPAVGFSIMSRSRSKKRHDCTFDGCGFSTCYLKDLVRHMRRHTGKTRLYQLQESWLIWTSDECVRLSSLFSYLYFKDR